MRTRRLLLVVAVLLLITGLAVGSVQGAPAGPAGTYNLNPAADAFVRNTNDTFNAARLSVYATNPPQPPNTCRPRDVSYLKFDLSGIPSNENIIAATLVLSVQEDFSPPCLGSLPMAVKGSLKDDWSEVVTTPPDPNVITWVMHTTQMNLGGILASSPSTCSGNVTFTGPDLVTFLKGRKGGLATLAITSDVSLGCGSDATLYQYLRSKDQTVGPKPQLNLTTEVSTAVTMSTFRSADPAVNWPLIAGLGALAAVVIGGLAVNRRRAAGR